MRKAGVELGQVVRPVTAEEVMITVDSWFG